MCDPENFRYTTNYIEALEHELRVRGLAHAIESAKRKADSNA